MNLGVVADIGLGLMLMYLLLSLLVTAINELIAQFGSIRARHLQSALKRMLNLKANPTDSDDLTLFEAIRNSPTLQIAGAIAKTKFSGANTLPSYIDRETFVASLREAISRMQKPAAANDANALEITELGALIDKLPENSQVKSALKAAIGGALADAQEVEKRVGDWFDNMMQRATGAYKRWMNIFSLILGLVLAVAFNCDTIHFADSVAKSPALRAGIVKVAEDITQRCAGANDKPAMTEADCNNAKRNLDALQALPIGGERNITFYAIAGWLITGFAVSLGAPFWFDLLSKFMNVRSSFKAEDKPAQIAAK